MRGSCIQQLSRKNGALRLYFRLIRSVLSTHRAVGELLPQDKLRELEALRSHLTGKGRLLYAGDGINDTPVLASADIGIAMGGLGADAAIETAALPL